MTSTASMLPCNVAAAQTVAQAPSLSTAIGTISFISNHEDSVKSRRDSSTVTMTWSTVKNLQPEAAAYRSA